MDLNLDALQRLSTKIKNKILNWRQERQIPAWKLAVLQQFIFAMLMMVSTSPYMIAINFDELSKNHRDYQNPSDFSSIVQYFETRKFDYQLLNVVSNSTLAVGMLLIFFGATSTKYTLGKRIQNTQATDKIVNKTIVVVLTWLTLCINFFLPLKHVMASRSSRGVWSIFTNPLSSIGTLLLSVLSLPFSLVEKSPLHQMESSQLTKDDIMSRIDPQNIFILSYNWGLLVHTILLLASAALLNMDSVKDREEPEVIKKSQEILEKHLETKTRIRPTRVTEENITPINMNLLNKSQSSKSKIRPVNVIKPLNVHSTSPATNAGNVSNKVSKFINIEESGYRPKRDASIESKDQNTQIPENKTFDGQYKSRNFSTKYEQNSIEPILKFAVGCQVSDQNECWSKIEKDTVKIDVGCQQTDQNVSLNFSKETVSIGVSCSPMVSNKSQQKRMKGIDTYQQTLHTDTLDTSQQCETTMTQDAGQQSSPSLRDDSVQCELLSQERFLKLQQSALTLYKKTIQKQEQDYANRASTTLSRKAKIENKVNVSIQVDMVHIPVINKKISMPEGARPCLIEKSDDGETYNNNTIEVQTDLYGYVLDKIIQERESSTTIYSKMDLDQTVNSALTLTEPVKRLTESIRFKAIKSQHGVWYVSLRGDVFLTVARETLRNTQINSEHNIPSEVSYDVLRAMKHFVDNYNKLSDCFEEDDESDDESYINGFRL